jgi:hypothetical protein
MTIKLQMSKVKETKGTVVYGNQDEGAAITSVYIMKSAFTDGNYPEKVTLEVK